jgi:hypothetical protein
MDIWERRRIVFSEFFVYRQYLKKEYVGLYLESKWTSMFFLRFLTVEKYIAHILLYWYLLRYGEIGLSIRHLFFYRINP